MLNNRSWDRPQPYLKDTYLQGTLRPYIGCMVQADHARQGGDLLIRAALGLGDPRSTG